MQGLIPPRGQTVKNRSCTGELAVVLSCSLYTQAHKKIIRNGTSVTKDTNWLKAIILYSASNGDICV